MKKNSIAIVGIFLFCSCVNLAHINQYAHKSVESLECFHDIPFSFNSYCTQYSSTAISNNLQTEIKELPQPDCSVYKNSDSALNILHRVLLLYLQGLEKVSANDLTTYNLDATVDNLTTLQTKLGFTIESSQITSAKNIVTKLLNASLNAYRKKKIKNILLQTKGDFDNVMNAYIFGISALNAEDSVALINYKTLYTYHFLEAAHDDAIKILAVNDYRKKQMEMGEVQQAIATYIQSLQVIKSGHHGLASSANNLTSASLITMLEKANEQLTYLKEQFQNLKNIK